MQGRAWLEFVHDRDDLPAIISIIMHLVAGNGYVFILRGLLNFLYCESFGSNVDIAEKNDERHPMLNDP